MVAGLNLLHNTFLKIRLELCRHGLAFRTVWMGFALWSAFRPMNTGPPLLSAAASFAL